MPEMPYPILDTADVMGFLAQAAKKWLSSSLVLQEWGETLTSQNANPAMCPPRSTPHVPAAASSQPSSGCPRQPELLQPKAQRGREKWCCYDGSHGLGNVEKRESVRLVPPWEPLLVVGTTTLPKLCAIHIYLELTLQRKDRGKQCGNKSRWLVAPHASWHYACHAEPYCIAACMHSTQWMSKSPLSLLALGFVAIYLWFPRTHMALVYSAWWSSFLFPSW